MLNSIGAGVWFIDPQGRTIFANPAMAEMLGFSNEEMVLVTLFDVLTEAERPQALVRLARRSRGIRERHDATLIRRDKKRIRALLDCYPVYSENGTYLGAIATATDITARAEVEEQLREREARYRALAQILPVGVLHLDLDGRSTFANERWCEWTGVSKDAILGRCWLSDLHPADAARLQDLSNFLPKFDDRPVTTEFRLLGSAKIERWLLGQTLAHRNEGGDKIGYIVTVTDITELKTLVATLNERQREIERLNAALERRIEAGDHALARQAFAMDATSEGMAILSNGLYVYNNPPHAEMYGHSASDLIGRSWETLYDEAEVARIKAEVFPVLGERGNWVGEVRGLRKNGSHFDAEINLTLAPSGDLICCCRDISRRKAEEKALKQSRDELAQLNRRLQEAARLKDEFLASMSHELRTPLSAVLGLAEALQYGTYGPLSEAQCDGLKTIQDCGRHLLRLINDILDLSKIEAGQMELLPQMVAVEPLCRDALNLVREMAPEKAHVFSFSIEPLSAMIYTDPTRLKQMLVNLLSNAVKFTPAGRSVGMKINGEKSEGVLRFTVWDDGIGIAAEDLPKLFKPFVQLDSGLSREQMGTGLGLALVHRMAEAQGGSVEVESAPNCGSRFTIALPWDGRSASNRIPASQPPSNQRIALVCGRDEMLRELGVEALRAHDFDVHFSEMGRAILRCAEVLAPSLICIAPGSTFDSATAKSLRDWKQSSPELKRIICIGHNAHDLLCDAGLESIAQACLPEFSALRSMLCDLIGYESSPESAPSSVPASGAARVLIVDDNRTNLNFLSAHLSSCGFSVSMAESGEEGIQRCRSERPDVVLMDIQMPRMDGLEAIRRIRQLPDPGVAATPIIALTALAMHGDRERCLAAGADEYMSKPVSLLTLSSYLHRFAKDAGEAVPSVQ